MTPSSENPELISYKHLQKFVGCLALSLPVITWLFYALLSCGSVIPLDSISEYYYTFMRDVFVGILFMVGLFLYAYKGYNPRENRAFNFAAILCALIALFSMNPVGYPLDKFPFYFNNRILIIHFNIYSYIHYLSATILFIILGYVSIFFFTKTRRDKDPTPKKLKRNRLYRICGWLIWSALLFYVLCFLAMHFAGHNIHNTPVLFCVETVCLWSFGLAWLVKGEGIEGLRD